MRIVNLGEVITYIHGSMLTPFFYRQYFRTEFHDAVRKAVQDGLVVNHEYAYRLLWVLVKTYEPKTIDYDQWIGLVEIKGTDWEIELLKEIHAKFYFKTKTEEKEEKNDDINYEVSMLVNAKKLGLTLAECDLFSLQDYVDFIDVHFAKSGPRTATQDDIDKLLA